MDATERLCDVINSIDDLPMKCKVGFLNTDNSLKVFANPGGRVVSEDFAGNSNKVLPYSVGIRTADQQLADSTMWKISTFLDNLNELKSQDGSFTFNSLELNGLPNVSVADERGYFTYLLDFEIDIDTKIRRV